MTFNPAVWQFDPEQDMRGHNWENEKEPRYEENKKCGSDCVSAGLGLQGSH